MIFDNYINAREGQNLMRRAFSGVTFNAGVGSPVTGQGLSREAAGMMGGQLAAFGARDQVFTGREINSLTSMSAQMGMLDNVPSDQIVNRMKSITRQVKLIMSLADTPDMKEAMSIMAKLNAAGASPLGAASAYASIAGHASQAGISSGRLFNTMGAQGQYLFQSNGLTPYVGQLSAGAAVAGFSSAFRNGLISNDLMARMGGMEGAVQSSVTGQLSAAQTVYNQVKAFNRYTSGEGGQGVIQNMTNFGRTFANDPIGAYGAYLRTGRANASRMMEDEGPLGAYSQMKDIAGLYYGNKQLNQNQMFGLFMPIMGNDRDAVQAYMTQLGTYQNPQAVAQMRAGSNSARAKMMRNYLEQSEQTLFMANPLVSGTVKGIRSARGGLASMIGNAISNVGGTIDYLEGKVTEINIGDMKKLTGIGINDVEDDFRMPMINSGRMDRSGDIAKLIKAAGQGNAVARRALTGSQYDIETAARTGIIDSKFANADSRKALAYRIGLLPKDLERSIKGESLFDLETGIDSGMFKGMDRSDAYEMYNIGRDLFSAGDLRNVTGKAKEQLERFMTATGTDVESVRGAMDKAALEAHNMGIDYSVKGGRQPGESFKEFLMRNSARVRGRIPNKGNQISPEDAIAFDVGQGAMNRDDKLREEAVRKMMAEGHIEMASSYQMKFAVDKFDDAVNKFVTGVKGKEVIAGQPESASTGLSWRVSEGFGFFPSTIKGADRSR